MAADFRKFDEQGFPVPPRFEDLKFYDEEPRKAPKVSLAAKRWLLILLVVGVVVPLFFGPQIVSKVRGLLADWLSSQATQKSENGDLAGAIADLNQAIDWNPTNWELFSQRADLREEMNQLEGSLTDLNRAIELYKGARLRKLERGQRPRMLSRAHSRRSWIFVRLNRKAEAMADANLAVELYQSPETLNGRAYARAILGIELEDGLRDIEKALSQSGNEPNMLDTRGYLLHLLGRNTEALEEMNRALSPIEVRKNTIDQARLRFVGDPAFQRELQRFERSMAVMYHHRGLIHKQLGNEIKADEDLRRAQDLGFNPDNGVL